MDKNLIEKYKAEMLEMYKKKNKAVKTDVFPVKRSGFSDVEGGLITMVTTLRNLYPVPNAKVTVFTGNIENKEIIDSDFTDQSGRTKTFLLNTPSKAISLDENSTQPPYSTYNVLVEADGYLDNIHLNIPVFSGVTSLQSADLLLRETSGQSKGPQVFDEFERYEL